MLYDHYNKEDADSTPSGPPTAHNEKQDGGQGKIAGRGEGGGEHCKMNRAAG